MTSRQSAGKQIVSIMALVSLLCLTYGLRFSHPGVTINSTYSNQEYYGLGVDRIERRSLGKTSPLFQIRDAITIEFDIQCHQHITWFGGHIALSLKRGLEQIWIWLDQECLAVLFNRADIGFIKAHEYPRGSRWMNRELSYSDPMSDLTDRGNRFHHVHLQIRSSGTVTMGFIGYIQRHFNQTENILTFIEPHGGEWSVSAQAENYAVTFKNIQVTAC